MFTTTQINEIRKDFPILNQSIRNDKQLIYLDSAATSQKPWSVLNAERDFLITNNAAAHRGLHQLAENATIAYESARNIVASFIKANSNEIVFTKSATESINLLAYALSDKRSAKIWGTPLGVGDEIVISELEHHANIIPWQEARLRTGCKLKWFKSSPTGRIIYDPSVITKNTKIVAITYISNVTGTITDIIPVIKQARSVGALVILDACQAVAHYPINVKELDVDFLVFSSHKMYGPYGIGVLYGKFDLLQQLPPFITGGSMIKAVSLYESSFTDAPQKFEAGVPPVAPAVGLQAAATYINELGINNITIYEKYLTQYLISELTQISNLKIIGPTTTEFRSSVVSFTLEGIHSHDVGQILDNEGIAVRVGHHCAMPLHTYFNISSSTRVSLAIYNTIDEIDELIKALDKVNHFFN